MQIQRCGQAIRRASGRNKQQTAPIKGIDDVRACRGRHREHDAVWADSPCLWDMVRNGSNCQLATFKGPRRERPWLGEHWLASLGPDERCVPARRLHASAGASVRVHQSPPTGRRHRAYPCPELHRMMPMRRVKRMHPPRAGRYTAHRIERTLGQWRQRSSRRL
jgi:hypothetical protein